MLKLIAHIGRSTTRMVRDLADTLSFSLDILIMMFSPGQYNRAMRKVLVNQIYFTAVQILPLVLSVAVVFGSLLIGIVLQVFKDLGLTEYVGHILMGFVVTELAPFMTVLLLALRSSSAINTEIAVMKVNKELQTLETFNINLINYLFLPRIINGMVSTTLLSALFSIIVLTSGLVFANLLLGMGVNTYSDILVRSAGLTDLIVFFLKCLTFGFFITMIPVRSGFAASEALTSIPIAVLSGMVKVFKAIVVIEVLSLIIRYI